MSVVKINAIHVAEGKGPELEERFANRKMGPGLPGCVISSAILSLAR